MEHPDFAEQDYGDSTSLALTDFRAEIDEKRLNVAPRNVAARGMREHQLQRSLALSLHVVMVLRYGTMRKLPRLPKRGQIHFEK